MGCLTCLQPNPVGISCTTWQLLAFRPPCTSGFHTDVAACYPRPSASVGKLTPGEEHLMPRREKPVDQLFLFIHSCSLPLPISHTQRWLLPSEPCGSSPASPVARHQSTALSSSHQRRQRTPRPPFNATGFLLT